MRDDRRQKTEDRVIGYSLLVIGALLLDENFASDGGFTESKTEDLRLI